MIRESLVFCCLALALSSCGDQKATVPAPTHDATSLSDSLSTASVMNMVKPDSFQTPDLALYNLHGPVRVLIADQSVIYFDEDGHLISLDGHDPFDGEGPTRVMMEDGSFMDVPKFKRNEQGQIAEQEMMESYTRFTWQDNRLACDEGEGEGMRWLNTYEYSADGMLNKLTERYCDVDMDVTKIKPVITTYQVTEKDHHGNWFRRLFFCNGSEGENYREIYYFGDAEPIPDHEMEGNS